MLRSKSNTKTFEWSTEALESFRKIKDTIGHHITLSIFDPDLPTIVTCDASDYGIGGVLSQVVNGEEKIVTCASRTLTECERKYSVGKKEALACVWSCLRWNTYLWGRNFTLRTDHKGLTTLLSPKGAGRQSMRIARWNAKLLYFHYNIVYTSGCSNKIADYLSRSPLPEITDEDVDDEVILSVFDDDSTLSVKLSELQDFTKNDPLLQEVIHYTSFTWPIKDTKLSTQLRKFFKLKDELWVCKNILMRGSRVVAPSALTPKLCQIAHACHQGIIRTKQRLRELYWWSGMDSQIEMLISTCIVCQNSDKTANTSVAPMTPVPTPAKPWEKLAIDIVGPDDRQPHASRFAITMIDYYTKWPEIAITGVVTSSAVITFLKSVFSREGYPAEIITGHGVQFVSHEFESFLKSRNIKHSLSAIYHPQSNGLVERLNRSLKDVLQTARREGDTDINKTVQEFLTVYRSTLLHGR
ncbi:hypothetical protein SNE40_009818 [Patella caerulea]|uniref:Integrase catalytic domain-containing protein n=1 Tax=Patella caerulea TaxID=87958 RepID=A0AAN8PQS6_PATCE